LREGFSSLNRKLLVDDLAANHAQVGPTVNDASGTRIAGRGWFIAGGFFCLLPLFGYFVFVLKQGYFDR
jgi:hypothetical protein